MTHSDLHDLSPFSDFPGPSEQTDLSERLWDLLERSPWAAPADFAEALICLLYARWLERESNFFARGETEKRWVFWRELSPRARYRHLQQIVWPLLQSRAPMSGQLLGLILPTVPFAIPEAPALSALLELIESQPEQALLTALEPLLCVDEPATAVLEEALTLLRPGPDTVFWEPCCRSGRFLALGARQLQQRHWRQIWCDPSRLQRFRQQFFGRVANRGQALLSAMNLLLANQPSPGLDGYSLPWPSPDLIWTCADNGPEPSSLLPILAPEGRLVIWHPGSARQGRVALSQGGSLEIQIAPCARQVREPVLPYPFHPPQARTGPGLIPEVC